MKLKIWGKYLFYLATIFFCLFLNDYFTKQLKVHMGETFRVNLYLLTILIFIRMGIGLILGLEHFMAEIKKEGDWRINLPQIIVLGLPALFFSLFPLLVYSEKLNLPSFLVFPSLIILNSNNLLQMIFGYFFITSFYKEKNMIKYEQV